MKKKYNLVLKHIKKYLNLKSNDKRKSCKIFSVNSDLLYALLLNSLSDCF